MTNPKHYSTNFESRPASSAALLQQIAAEVVLLSPDDHVSRRQIETMLREIAQSSDLPDSIKDPAWDAIVLLQKLVQTTDHTACLNQLSELLDRMLRLETQWGASSKRKEEAPPEKESAVSAERGVADLLSEFLQRQTGELEGFEAACLALENGDRTQLAALKRWIHTWKGEAGILGLFDLAEALHSVETTLESPGVADGAMISDGLLELKDQLQKYFEAKQKSEKAVLNVARVIERLTHSRAAGADLSDIPSPPAKATGRIFKVPAEIDLDLVQEFRCESAEHFQQAELSLLNLENDPNDLESINTVFRAFHTVKGVSGFVGLSYITELAHKAETFFDRFRKGQMVMQGAYTDLAFEAVDMLKGFLSSLNEVIAAGSFTAPSTYDELIRKLENPELQAEASGSLVASPAAAKVGELLIRQGQADPDSVAEALESQSAGDERPLGEILVEQKAARPQDVAHALRIQRGSAKEIADAEGTVKVNTSRLDNLINMVGELVIAQSMVSQDPEIQRNANQRLVRNVGQLNKITRSLQELALSMRMVSVKPTFQKMARLIRDLARKSHKEILFEIEGEDTELDRNMVEAIADPLVHMVRNAADHGIESPAERESCGKPRQGRVLLRAAHEGGSVVITLQDDGRGLNTQKIKAKAVERGLIDANAALTDTEIHQLIFLPGFSTADKVTDVSGRGVGMDVVRTNIESLRGTVEIKSTQGAGSIFSVRLPLTMAIIDGMVIRVGSERYILPTVAITDTFRARAEDVTTVQQQAELVLLRGELIPVCRLHRLFRITGSIEEIAHGTLVVVESKSRRVALLTDELLGQQQVVIKSLGSVFSGVKGISGGAILGDGRVCLILDVEGLVALSSMVHV